MIETGDDAQERALAAAGRADQRDEFAGFGMSEMPLRMALPANDLLMSRSENTLIAPPPAPVCGQSADRPRLCAELYTLEHLVGGFVVA